MRVRVRVYEWRKGKVNIIVFSLSVIFSYNSAMYSLLRILDIRDL